jgi:hypothetical protein
MGAINGHFGLLMAATPTVISYLDSLATTPRSVLSLRKLISTATASIRVRRSSDNAEQDIGFTGNALDTASLATFVGSDSAYVTKFYDQTGNAEHGEQATSGNQARIVNAGTYDGKLVFNGTSNSLKITTLTCGTPQLGYYAKIKLPSASGLSIILEQSANFNSVDYSSLIYVDSSTTPKMNYAMQNINGLSQYRDHKYAPTLGALAQFTALMDRAKTGASELYAAQAGTALTPTYSSTPSTNSVEQTGNFGSYDLFIGSRAGSAYFAAMDLETLVIYTADTASIQSQIEAIVA